MDHHVTCEVKRLDPDPALDIRLLLSPSMGGDKIRTSNSIVE